MTTPTTDPEAARSVRTALTRAQGPRAPSLRWLLPRLLANVRETVEAEFPGHVVATIDRDVVAAVETLLEFCEREDVDACVDALRDATVALARCWEEDRVPTFAEGCELTNRAQMALAALAVALGHTPREARSG